MTGFQSVKFNQLLQKYVSSEMQVRNATPAERPVAEGIATKYRQKLQNYVEMLTTTESK